MRFLTLNGKLKSQNIERFRMDWDKKSRSNIQFEVKQFLKPYWVNQICYEEMPVFGTLLKVDLVNVNKRIAIEVNGPQHNTFNKFFHNNSRYKYKVGFENDYKKYEWLTLNNFSVIEIYAKDMASLSKQWILENFQVSI